jgi:hypothetical protein
VNRRPVRTLGWSSGPGVSEPSIWVVIDVRIVTEVSCCIELNI